MEWIDEAIVLSTRPHGETAVIAVLMTAEHGRHAGLVGGGQSARVQAALQSGNLVQARWRARLLDHLGNYALEPSKTTGAPWLDEPEILGLIASACAVTESAVPERQPLPGIYAGLAALFSLSEAEFWAPAYVKWEMELLRALGYGLDLNRCAVSGETEGLSHVSPRTGRAVTTKAAAPYQDKLLSLPAFLLGDGEWDAAAIVQGLELTGHFLTRLVYAHGHGRMPGAPDLPPARLRLLEYYRRLDGQGKARIA